MREILFRGKRIDNGEWVEGFYNHIPRGRFGADEHMIQTVLENGKIGMLYDIDPSTIGQYKGIKDKHGKRIFEGDIVVCRQEIAGNFIDSCVAIGFVEMKRGTFGFHRKRVYYRDFKDWIEDYECEVIGNIHDNPELLGK